MGNDFKPSQHITRHFTKSLTFKVSFLVAAIMVIVLMVFSAVFVLSERKKVNDEILAGGKTFAAFSAQTIYGNYVAYYTHPTTGEFDTFKQRVEATMKLNADVAHIELLGITGRILFTSDEFKTGKYQGPGRSVDEAGTLDALKSPQMSVRQIKENGVPYTEIVVPLDESGLGHVLSMRYLISYASREARLQEVYGQIATVAIPLLLFAIGVAVPFAIGLTRPIIRLTRVAEQIRAGDFNVRANVKGEDEIGLLGLTVNDMVERLRGYYDELEAKVKERTRELEEAETQLEQANQGLERKVEERTRALSEAQAQLIAAVRSLPFGFGAIDPDHHIVFSNALLGELVEQRITNGRTAASATALRKIAEHFMPTLDIMECLRMTTDERRTVEKNINLGPRFFRLFFVPVVTGDEVAGTVLILEDTTEEKAAQRSRDEFFSIASHELRTPLTAIRGNAGMMLSYYKDELKSPDLQQMVTDVHDASVHLIAIVNDFLDMSRLEQGKIVFKIAPFDPVDLIQKTIREYEVTGSRQKVAIEMKPFKGSLPMALADADRSRQILVNLIGNALKFTENGSITVELTVVGSRMQISVTDTGKGIATETQHLLFHKFQQATDSILTRDNTRGTGLGLYISRLLAEGMGGSLSLAWTRTNEGSCFVLELPLAPAEQPTEKKAA